MLWWFQVNSEGAQPYINMYPFCPKLPSHLGCRITLSRVPHAIPITNKDYSFFFNNNLFDPNNEDFHVLGQYYPHLEERMEEWCLSLSIIKQCPVSLFVCLPHGTAWGIFPNQGSNLHPLQWKGGVLTTGVPGKSNNALFSNELDKTSFELFSVSRYPFL